MTPLSTRMLRALLLVGFAFAGFLMDRGYAVARARYAAMLLPAAFMPAAIFAYYTTSFALCIALISLATALHQAWSATVLAVATDLVPSRVAGAVTGLGTTAGGIGGMLLTLLAGAAIQLTGNQQAVFIWAGLMHPISWIILRSMAGREWKQVSLDKPVDLSQPSPGLQIGGAVAAVLGLTAVATIVRFWSSAVAATHSVSAVAAAVTAASGILIIGCLLLYAGARHEQLA